MTTELAAQLNADVTIDIDPHLPRLHTATEVAILRAAQGALANVRRHADAGHVRVDPRPRRRSGPPRHR